MFDGQGMKNGNYGLPPPSRRNVPRYNSDYYPRKSGGRSCLRCICWCYCILFLLIFILTALAFYFYTLYQPKVPSYKIQDLDVKSFDLLPDFSLNTVFLVTVEADNTNKAIGFTYGQGSSVIVEYTDSRLCSGSLPSFHQGPHNMTLVKIELKGRSEFGSGLQQALQDSKEKGRIPLLVRIQVPVSVVVGQISTRQLHVFVNCTLEVDNLAPGKKIGILSSKYDFDITLWDLSKMPGIIWMIPCSSRGQAPCFLVLGRGFNSNRSTLFLFPVSWPCSPYLLRNLWKQARMCTSIQGQLIFLLKECWWLIKS